jgi:GDPmannose 4,6-dehydratase
MMPLRWTKDIMKACSVSGKLEEKPFGGFYMSAKKVACITGASGMDAAYLAQYLLSLDYKVVGIKRRSSTDNLWRLRFLGILDNPNLVIEEGDITDVCSLISVFKKHNPSEVYSLAAMSHVGTSFSQPQLTWDVTGQGAINVINAALIVNESCRIYNSASSEIFGSNYDTINGVKAQNELTKMEGNSPYGVAKLAAFNYTRMVREGKGNFVCSGILYNHSSILRGEHFFERKVTKYIGQLVKWINENRYGGELGASSDLESDEQNLMYGDRVFPKLRLGDLSTYRDMGHSKDYVRLQHQMLQQDQPEDFVICTGETFQMKDIVKLAFQAAGLDWEHFTYIDKSLFRPREVEYLRGDCSKAKEKLGWAPTYDLKTMIQEMVDQDIKWAEEDRNYG